jgi:hypothetical protein
VYAECDTSQHATYLSGEQIVKIPFLDIPLLNPLTQKPTGEVAVAHVDLSLIDGADDFKIVPDTLEVTEVVSEASECHATYNYDGVLHIPNIDVQSVIILPPGIIADSITRTFEATLQQLPLSPDVFHLEEYALVGSGTDDTGGGDTGGGGDDDPPPPPAPECSLEEQAQLVEPFTLYNAVMPMVVVENDIMGEWPNPLSSVITPPTGVYTAGLETHDPFHIDATMKTEDEGVASCFAGKTIHFIFDPSARTWGCSTDIPAEYMTLFPMTCTQ